MDTNKKPVLPPGYYHVRITSVSKGKSEKIEASYFTVKFENQRGYIENRFFLHKSDFHYINKLFRAVSMEVGNTMEDVESRIEALLKRELFISIDRNPKSWMQIIRFEHLSSNFNANMYEYLFDLNTTNGRFSTAKGKNNLTKSTYYEDLKELILLFSKDIMAMFQDLDFEEYLLSNDDDIYNEYLSGYLDYEEHDKDTRFDDEEPEISKYGGIYGLDDETIDEAFEGDPEWYWNVD